MWKILQRIHKSLRISRSFSSDSMNKMSDLRSESHDLPLYLKRTMSDWEFSTSSALQFGLPVDSVNENHICPNVQGAIFSKVNPSPLKTDVMLAAYSKDVLINILNMHPSIISTKEFVDWVAGGHVLSSSTPMAHRYGGHQFGYWAMQLGDGRAISLGEFVSHDGKRWDIQLKGSGLTPYSRGGDGRAVIRSSVREFLCSEAMYSLGIPTSRAGALIVSSDTVVRDKFYDGRPEAERTAIVMRIAPSWLRFGSLEILARNNELVELRQLLDYAIMLHMEANQGSSKSYISFFEHVCTESINLVAFWQSVGFTHGVMNTDNMSLFGITIDYGPFGFLEAYDPDFVPNTSDSWGRYAYSEQMKVVHWNLEKLAVAMSPLLTDTEVGQLGEILTRALDLAETLLGIKFNEKLGFNSSCIPQKKLHELLFKIMKETKSDFTMTFRQLGLVPIDKMTCPEELEKHWCLKSLSKHEQYSLFVDMYLQCTKQEGVKDKERCEKMLEKNPQYVLRNWMAQQAIAKAERDDFSDIEFLLEILSQPYTVSDKAEERGFSGPTPSWAKCLQMSCSS